MKSLSLTLRVTFIWLLAAVAPAQAFTRSPVTAENGMVVTSQHVASDVGVDILRQGGNAVDAAVAVGYALAVTNPCCGNIGGGGFATLHLADGRDVFLNFREKAPGAATATMFLDATRRSGAGPQPQGLPGGGGARHGDGSRHAVAEIRDAATRQGDGAGDQTGGGRFRPHAGRRRYSGGVGEGVCRTAQCGGDLPQCRQAMGGG